MSVSKKEFFEMLDKAIDTDIPVSAKQGADEEHTFSETFEKRMDDFFAEGRKESQKKKVRPKRWLLIAIAAVLALAATACAVPEIRESIAGFFVKVFGDHVEYVDPAITKERIEEEYGLVPVPEGFEEANIRRGTDFVGTDYIDSDDNCITLLQKAKTNLKDTVDTEHGTFYDCTINGIAVRIYYSDNSSQASWIENGYYFSLIYSSHVEQKLFEEWIASVKMK